MIIQNAICVNGEYLVSENRHDYKSKIIKKGKKEYMFMVDGGLDYFKGAQPPVKDSTLKRLGIKYENLRLTDTDDLNKIFDNYLVKIENGIYKHLKDFQFDDFEKVKELKLKEVFPSIYNIMIGKIVRA